MKLVIPKHLALIPDGNRRWAKRKGLPPWKGHEKGYKVFKNFLNWCLELNISQISFYTLSTENLDRPKDELNHIFRLLKKGILEFQNDGMLEKYDVKVRFLGDFRRIPSPLVRLMKKLMKKTEEHHKIIVNLLVAYGGQWELTQAAKKLIKKVLERGVIRITPKTIEKNLYVQTPVDLVIRTGAQYRLSNFLPWQTAYAEIYVTRTLFPAFSKREFMKAIRWFSTRKRNFGK